MAKTFYIEIDECEWLNYHTKYTEENYSRLKEHYKQYNQSAYDVLASVSFDDVVDILNGDKEDIMFDYVTSWGDIYKESVADIIKRDMRDCAYNNGTHHSGDVLDIIESIVMIDEEDDD